jgi:glycosyltransferase involved in cell wall biosynthesis
MEGLVSVLMPVYNGEAFIRQSIECILNQTYSDFEFIIVNDGSTDKTLDIINSFNDQRIILINQQNSGVAKALNKGLKHSSGKYIARLDADDLCTPDRLEIQLNFIKNNPEYIAIGSDVNYIDEEGNFIFRYYNPAYEYEEIKKNILGCCPFVHSSVIFLKQPVIEIGGYPEKAHSFEDHLLWAKIIKHGKIYNMKNVLVSYRFNISSVTIDEKDRDKTFLSIKQKAIETGEITEEEEQQLLKSIKSISKLKKECSYNRMISKKYLWNNYNPTLARKYIYKALKLEPFSKTLYLLFLISFLPQSLIYILYSRIKQ